MSFVCSLKDLWLTNRFAVTERSGLCFCFTLNKLTVCRCEVFNIFSSSLWASICLEASEAVNPATPVWLAVVQSWTEQCSDYRWEVTVKPKATMLKKTMFSLSSHH